MLCQNCQKNYANTHIKTMVNAQIQEIYVCSDCASKLGYGTMFVGFNIDLDDFFGDVLTKGVGEDSVVTRNNACSFCGCSFDDILNSGKVGCANCYRIFYDKLLPSIQRIHGNVIHTGKVPSSAGAKNKIKKEINKLKEELNEAVRRQEYENAALLRDKIKDMEQEGANNEKGSK